MCQACFHPDPVSGTVRFCQCGSPTTLAVLRRIEADISRRQMMGGMAAVVSMFAGFGLAPRQVRAQGPARPVLLTNLRLFDGDQLSLRRGVSILIDRRSRRD